jgi:hypothetical protein
MFVLIALSDSLALAIRLCSRRPSFRRLTALTACYTTPSSRSLPEFHCAAKAWSASTAVTYKIWTHHVQLAVVASLGFQRLKTLGALVVCSGDHLVAERTRLGLDSSLVKDKHGRLEEQLDGVEEEMGTCTE